MKLITIFSGKGGVGKTSMSILLASWLKYELHERVIVYDFESPEPRLLNKRNYDISLLQNKNQVLTELSKGNDFYPIGRIPAYPQGYSEAALMRIVDGIEQSKATGDGYIICDFPGRFEAREAIYSIASRGLIDLIAFPIQQEDQSIASMLAICKILRQPGFIEGTSNKDSQDILCFWNMITRNDTRSKIDNLGKYEVLFKAMNIPVSRTRVRYTDTVKRNSSAPVFVTTTVCYPKQFMLRAFPPEEKGSDKPYIEALFQEIKDRVDGTWEDRSI